MTLTKNTSGAATISSFGADEWHDDSSNDDHPSTECNHANLVVEPKKENNAVLEDKDNDPIEENKEIGFIAEGKAVYADDNRLDMITPDMSERATHFLLAP